MLLEPSEHIEPEQLSSDSCAWADRGEAADWVLNLRTEGFALHGPGSTWTESSSRSGSAFGPRRRSRHGISGPTCGSSLSMAI